MGLAAQERVGSFIDVSVVIFEDFSSEIPIGVAHHRHEHVDLLVEWVNAMAASCGCHPKSRIGVAVVFAFVGLGAA